MITPDSAWRNWRGAVRAMQRAEETLAGARAVWLQTLLEGFEQRRLDADAAGHDVTSKKALAALGLPCKDCLAPVPENCSGHTIVNGREADATYKLYATCGKAAINPVLVHTMPELFTLTEAASK